MKRLAVRMMIAGFACTLLLVPLASHADSDQAAQVKTAPPIGQQVVREGDFAVKAVAALGMGTAENEAEAESRLAEIGISPRNGWIADYPMTPDICGEIYKSVRDAADAGKVGLSIESALERLDGVMAQAGLSATASSEGAGTGGYSGPASAPGEAVINNYYYNEGPPIVTYYSPPYDYLYLYAWVPYPFWGYGFWFPGYYILNDFHRVAYAGRRGVFVSNHYRDLGGRRYTRIDPVTRFSGRAAATGGAVRSGLPTTGASRGSRGAGGTGSTWHPAPSSRFSAPASRGGGTYGTPSYRGRGAFNGGASVPRTAVTQQRSAYRGSPPSITTPSRSYRGNSVAAVSGLGNRFSSTPMAQSGFSGGSFRGSGMVGTSFRGNGFSGGGFSARGHR
ncbi:hypothetical protein F6V25_12905 [Oryzomonas japonica]|uniref:DUF3300 domain-containing protein n=1 Tax=Oryzomonas japonica TaxID=2603858 RepID=A0A7J4ZP19_9BACT|nr:hypothetical protein [Oryzomonas japonica]KAB0664435.1 hypothetical protein F6V25_12905 [Oryzomonas japonica]